MVDSFMAGHILHNREEPATKTHWKYKQPNDQFSVRKSSSDNVGKENLDQKSLSDIVGQSFSSQKMSSDAVGTKILVQKSVSDTVGRFFCSRKSFPTWSEEDFWSKKVHPTSSDELFEAEKRRPTVGSTLFGLKKRLSGIEDDKKMISCINLPKIVMNSMRVAVFCCKSTVSVDTIGHSAQLRGIWNGT